MRPRLAALVLLLAGCAPDPAELTVSLLEPATANAQYFHGNCFAGFSVRVEISRPGDAAGRSLLIDELDVGRKTATVLRGFRL